MSDNREVSLKEQSTKFRFYVMFGNKGITLITLIVTIIVLLILAGVATYSGIEAIENSKYTKFSAELKIMQTYVNQWYEDLKAKTGDFDENIQAKFTSANATNTLDNTALASLDAAGIDSSKYANFYFISNEAKEKLGVEGVSQEVLVDIKDRIVVSYKGLSYKGNMYYTAEDVGGMYNVEYNNKNTNAPNITVSGKSVYYGNTAKNAKYKFTINITQSSPYIDKGTVFYSKLDNNNEVIGWTSTEDTNILVEREGKYRFYYKDTAGNVSNSVDYVIEPKAELISGLDFNIKMKTLSGTQNPEVTTENTNITEFKISNTRPSNTIINNPDNKVSTNKSQFDVYMWFENGTIWLWSEENWIYLNSSCAHMFRLLKSVENIDLTVFDTSKTTSMNRFLASCSNLKKLDLNGFNTQNVNNMQLMFSGCSSLKDLDLSNFNTQKVTTMQEMFRGCSELVNLNLSNLSNDNVTTMAYMLYSCSKLTNLNLSHFCTPKVTDMTAMFCYCRVLKTIDLSNFDTSKVTSMKHMFNGCNALTNLNLLNFDTSKVTDMNFMFANCDELTNLDLSSFNTSNVKGMYKMLCSCDKLKTINVTNAFSVTSLTDEQVPEQPEGHINSNYIFTGSTLLVGGSGTPYDADHTDKAYAHIDGGQDNPGYFTRKPRE